MRAVQRDWSLRVYHEATLHFENWRDADTGVVTSIPNSCVITLTFDDEHLPANGALDHEYFQRFMKRVRQAKVRAWAPDLAPVTRFFMCGEYGGKTHRPHFHAILMGQSFSDRYTEVSRDGQTNSMSHQLDALWSEPPAAGAAPTKIGRATVEEFSFAGAMYVAGYVAKKQGDSHPGPFVETLDPLSGEVSVRAIQPEYRKMSTGRAPAYGLGHGWLRDRIPDVYGQDSVNVGKWTFRPPRYYDVLLRRYRPDLLGPVLRGREAGQFEAAVEWTPARCSAAEQVALSSFQQRRDSL